MYDRIDSGYELSEEIVVESLRCGILSLFLAFASGASFVECEASNNGKFIFSRFSTTRRSVYHNEKLGRHNWV